MAILTSVKATKSTYFLILSILPQYSSSTKKQEIMIRLTEDSNLKIIKIQSIS